MPKTIEEKIAPELERITFYLRRDGPDSDKPIREVLNIYRKAVLCSRKRGHSRPHFASTEKWRKEFILSYIAFRTHLTKLGRYG